MAVRETKAVKLPIWFSECLHYPKRRVKVEDHRVFLFFFTQLVGINAELNFCSFHLLKIISKLEVSRSEAL